MERTEQNEGSIIRIPDEFAGRGDASMYAFRKVYTEDLGGGRFAYVYEQSYEGGVVGYEAVRPVVKEDKAIMMAGDKVLYEATGRLREFYPSSEQWGTNGFTLRTMDDAVNKIKERFVKSLQE